MRLSVSDLGIERGGRIVFRKISFALGSGESMSLTGPNGAGKSTLLRALAGLLPITEGRIDCTPPAGHLAETVHYIGHADALKASLTARENLQFWAAMLGSDGAAPSVETALGRFGLAAIADLPAAYLSAGQKRRLALAKLLVASRPIWLLDEPMTALDAVSQAMMGETMLAHLAGGGLVVAATHAPLLLDGRELRLGKTA